MVERIKGLENQENLPLTSCLCLNQGPCHLGGRKNRQIYFVCFFKMLYLDEPYVCFTVGNGRPVGNRDIIRNWEAKSLLCTRWSLQTIKVPFGSTVCGQRLQIQSNLTSQTVCPSSTALLQNAAFT